jgi:hypothetical protein
MKPCVYNAGASTSPILNKYSMEQPPIHLNSTWAPY